MLTSCLTREFTVRLIAATRLASSRSTAGNTVYDNTAFPLRKEYRAAARASELQQIAEWSSIFRARSATVVLGVIANIAVARTVGVHGEVC
jgi:hypothetical protein